MVHSSLNMNMKAEQVQVLGGGGGCLMMNGDTPLLVVSAIYNRYLVWIQINDVTMDHHHTQQLDYNPYQSYNDGDQLLVCGGYNNKIHRYSSDGQSLGVISLPGDVRPWGVTRYGDQYVISDNCNNQIVSINKAGQVKIRYKGEIHGVKIGSTYDVRSRRNNTSCRSLEPSGVDAEP